MPCSNKSLANGPAGAAMPMVSPVLRRGGRMGFSFFPNLEGNLVVASVTFVAGMVVTEATRKVIKTLRERAAKIWDIDVEAVEWENGEARPVSTNAGQFEPLTLAELAAKSGATGGPINALSSFIDNKERILTIEDTAELQLQQVHVGRMESRPPNVEGKGAVTTAHVLGHTAGLPGYSRPMAARRSS